VLSPLAEISDSDHVNLLRRNERAIKVELFPSYCSIGDFQSSRWHKTILKPEISSKTPWKRFSKRCRLAMVQVHIANLFESRKLDERIKRCVNSLSSESRYVNIVGIKCTN